MWPRLWILLLTVLVPLVSGASLLRPHIVASSQKISDSSGYLSSPGAPGTDPGGFLVDGDRFGSVAPLGLFDGDAVPDIAVGAYRRDLGGSNRGAVYVLTLNADGTVKSRVEIGHGSAGLTLSDGDEFGRHVVALGDVDGDGVVDLAADAGKDDTGGAQAGAVYILFLNADGTLKDFTKIASGVGGGPSLSAGDRLGVGMGALGDLNGDGVPDLAVGAFLDDDAGGNAGAVYLFTLKGGVGEPNPGEVLGTVKIRAGLNGFTGPAGGIWFGRDVSVVGDLDGDQRPELAVGTSLSDEGGTWVGEVWLLSLRTVAAGDSAGDVGKVFAETRIGALSGAFPGSQLDDGDQLGTGVAPLGDLDGDGIPDLAVNAAADDDGGDDRGAIWLLYLNANGTVKHWDKFSDTRGCFGGGLDDSDVFGVRTALLGDLSGDGTPEFAVSAEGDDDGGADRGAVYVLSLEQPAPASLSVVCASLELEVGVNRTPSAEIAVRQGVSPVAVLNPSGGSFTLPGGVLGPASGTLQSPFSATPATGTGDVSWFGLELGSLPVGPAGSASTVAPTGAPGTGIFDCPNAQAWPGGALGRVSGGSYRGDGAIRGTVFITHLSFAALPHPLFAAGAGGTGCAAVGAIDVRVAGVRWTDGTASAFYRTAMAGNPPPNATTTRRGFDARTTMGHGHLSLVTPIALQSTVAEDFPSFARLNLTFVPEPTSLVSLLAGAIGLAVLAARRRRP